MVAVVHFKKKKYKILKKKQKKRVQYRFSNIKRNNRSDDTKIIFNFGWTNYFFFKSESKMVSKSDFLDFWYTNNNPTQIYFGEFIFLTLSKYELNLSIQIGV